MSHSLMQKIAAARVKIAAGTITDEDLRDLLKEMRQGRVSASIAFAKSKAKKAKAAVPEDVAKTSLS